MAGHYAVTITASRTRVEPDRLARKIADILERPEEQVLQVLTDNTVVVQKELGYRQATRVQRELSSRGIPSQVTPHEELTGREVVLMKNDPGDDRPSPRPEQAGSVDGGDESEDSTSGPEDSRQSEQDDHHAPAATGSGAWGELFPDLEEEDEDDELDESPPPQQPEPEGTDGQLDDAEETLRQEFSAGFGKLEQEIERTGAGESSPGQAAPQPALEPSEPAASDPGSAKNTEASGGFDAAKISEAFASRDDDRPPYKPKGFDSRPAHIPLVAALLSLIAPGAGQVYNGQPDEARRYGWMFILIVPWIQAIRQAWRYGEKVRTYYAPRPEEGTGRKALMFGAKWWLVVLVFATITGTTVSAVMEYRQVDAQRQQQLVLQQLSGAADRQVRTGVERARQVVEQRGEQIIADSVDQGEYTMDDEERARRLFILGYHYCKGGEYQMCDQMMRRVASLEPRNRDAYQIQTWASLRSQGVGEDRQMPEINGEVPTLRDFEIELAARGEELSDIDEQFESWWNIKGEQAVADDEDEHQHDDNDGRSGPTLEQLGEELEVGE